ncbi:unnamed protein product [Leptosia nina]|uniref:Hepatic leukemia factor n=1 Tax=Leptosia nina TaxID=320188 RepID=A0AAV1JYU7_9NEOP
MSQVGWGLRSKPVRPLSNARQESKSVNSKDVLEDKKDDSELWEAQAAFLGPNLWDKTLPYDPDLKYVDLDEFLSENGMPGEALGGGAFGAGAGLALGLQPPLTKRERSPSPSDCMSPDTINPPLSPADSTFSMASSGRDFDPRTRAFSDEELKPQPMIKKSRKQFVPDDLKDDKKPDRAPSWLSGEREHGPATRSGAAKKREPHPARKAIEVRRCVGGREIRTIHATPCEKRRRPPSAPRPPGPLARRSATSRGALGPYYWTRLERAIEPISRQRLNPGGFSIARERRGLPGQVADSRHVAGASPPARSDPVRLSPRSAARPAPRAPRPPAF